MESIRARGELCLLAGDLNKHVGCGELGVPGNNREVSLGGRLLRDLLDTRNWHGATSGQGGPFYKERSGYK